MRAFLLLLLGLPASCALKDTTRQLDHGAYLAFEGEVVGLALQVDEEPARPLLAGEDVRYEVPPGRRRVRVWHGAEVVVDRTVFVSQGQVLEIALP